MKLIKLTFLSIALLLSTTISKNRKQSLLGANITPDSVAYGYATNDNFALQNAAVNFI